MLGRRRELLKDPVDELKLLRREDQRERVLLTNIKRTLRCSSRRARPTRPRWSSTASTTTVATCTKTTFLSASELGYEVEGYDDEDANAQCSSAGESDYLLSDCMDNDEVEMAQQDGDYPKLQVAQPDEERPVEDDKDEVGELSSVNAWSFESDSQAS
ncbi:hypothetical protein PF003_g27769 [Phytophthora fragariae]|nr:hypothetical protein PF003_g27769 [Phytophthora fragariae]